MFGKLIVNRHNILVQRNSYRDVHIISRVRDIIISGAGININLRIIGSGSVRYACISNVSAIVVVSSIVIIYLRVIYNISIINISDVINVGAVVNIISSTSVYIISCVVNVSLITNLRLLNDVRVIGGNVIRVTVRSNFNFCLNCIQIISRNFFVGSSVDKDNVIRKFIFVGLDSRSS